MKVLSDNTGLNGNHIIEGKFNGINPKSFPFTSPQSPNTIIDCEDELVEQYYNFNKDIWFDKEETRPYYGANMGYHSREAFKPKDILNQGTLSKGEVKEETVEELAEIYADKTPALFTHLNQALKDGYTKGHQATIDKVVEIVENHTYARHCIDLINKIKSLKP